MKTLVFCSSASVGNPNNISLLVHSSISYYYEFSKEQDYICSKPEDSGMHLCGELPQYRVGPMLCNGT